MDDLQLAPAAGSGIGKQLAELLIADEEFLPALKAAFMDALGAESKHFDKEAKGWVNSPDYKTRLSAAMSLLSHMEGDPIKRIVHQHLNAPSGGNIREALQESPALLAQVEREVAKAKFRDRNKRPEVAVELDVG
jgi:hypothetical protein